MANQRKPAGSGEPKEGHFVTTHWSVVLEAGRERMVDAKQALGRLCETYWPPIYSYLRRQGLNVQDAEDCTQGFFTSLLSHHAFARADPERGRFRSFLLTALRHYQADVRVREIALKRGGPNPAIVLDRALAEGRWPGAGQEALTPEQLYELRWALTLLETTLEQLARDFTRTGRADFFAELKGYVWGQQVNTPYRVIAARFGLSESAVRVTVHRLRQRFRELLRLEVAQTVARPEEIDEELHHLAEVLGR